MPDALAWLSNSCSHLGMVQLSTVDRDGPPAVPAGFPSPAEDYVDSLDLNEHLMPRPAATFVLRVSGYSMQQAGISDGDEVLVDRSLTPAEGHIVVASLDGEFTLKRLRTDPPMLEAANPAYPDIAVGEDGIGIWGVVTTVIRHVL